MASVSQFCLPSMAFGHNLDQGDALQPFSLHCHDCYEVYLFVSGEGYYVIEGNRYELRPLSLLVIRPGEVHCFRQTGQCDYERYVINFASDAIGSEGELPRTLLDPFLQREMGKQNLYHISEDGILFRIFREFDEIARLRPQTGPFEAGRLLGVMLANLARSMAAPAGSPGESETSCRLINGVIQYINENLTRPLRLDEIASHFYVSKYHLSRMFKKLIGVSVIDYVIRKRIFLAERLLRSGSTTAEACAGAGFGDYTSFYRSFRRVTGFSPAQMKNREPVYVPSRIHT